MIAVIIIYIFIFVIEFLPLWKEKKRKEQFLFMLLYLPSLVLAVLIVRDVKIPSFDIVVWEFMEKIGIAYKYKK